MYQFKFRRPRGELNITMTAAATAVIMEAEPDEAATGTVRAKACIQSQRLAHIPK
jgi:hypothetical protein